MVEYQSYVGARIAEVLSEVARLRIILFREYPYLYDGTEEYERQYLAGLAANERSLVLVARVDGAVVATATALPLEGDADILRDASSAFRRAGEDPGAYYYYSEILVQPEQRRSGIAREFYARRREHALGLGYSKVCFAAVEHEAGGGIARPLEYFDPAPMWESMGFVRRPEIAIRYHWPTLTDRGTVELDHRMVFWLKPLEPALNSASPSS